MSGKKGKSIGGKYEILEETGKGGSGQVYRVLDSRLEKIWAAKRILRAGPGKEEQALVRLENSAFPRIVDVVEEGDYRYLIMDWVEGETLEKRLKREGAFAPEEAVRIGIRLCRALETLHGMQPPLLYLDCKPSNIMLDREGNLWLVDFGSAVENGEMQAKPIAASPGYAAPELLFVEGERRCADARSDVFGLGRTLYALLSGRTLIRPSDAACRLEDCSVRTDRELGRIVERCMETDPDRRYQTVRAVREALVAWEEKPEGWGGPLLRKAAAKAGTAAGLCATAGSGILFYRLAVEAGRDWREKLVSLALFAAAACMTMAWRKFGAALICPEVPFCETLQSVIRTEKRAGRWLLSWPVAILLCAALFSGRAQSAGSAGEGESGDSRKAAGSEIAEIPMECSLPVILRDSRMRKLLVRSGMPLCAEESVYLELDPSLFEPGRTLVVRVTAREPGAESGEERTAREREEERGWTLLFRPQGKEEP